MRTSLSVAALACVILICASAASDAQLSEECRPAASSSRSETLWIFDADFEDLLGDNAGWSSEDRSGTLPIPNHWHKDTIRINGFEHLGDSTWWCGAYSADSACWRQPRGYGNDWIDCLERDFPLSSWSSPGDEVIFEWDQRIAMEILYDYGYVEVSTDGGASWSTIATMTNPGWEGTPGTSQDWDSDFPGREGHQVHDVSSFAGQNITLRFRFESDGAYSSQDQYDNPPYHSVLDGAWQLDNFTWTVNDTTRWYDDCESPGDNGWVHDAIPGAGQVGVVYERRFESLGGHTGWMMAAYDTTSGGMVDGQDCHLVSPPIDIADAPSLVARWEGWFDLTYSGNDLVSLWTAVSDIPDCFEHGGAFHPGPDWGPTYGGPMWLDVEQEWGSTGGWEWLSLLFRQFNHEPMASHGVGFVIDRVRVGVPLETGTPDGSVFSDGVRAVRPNPFNPSTTVEFSVGSRGPAALRVYDVAGHLVTTLREEELEPGEYQASWDGTDDSGHRVASGVYMLRLEVEGGASASAKAVLLE